MIRTITATGLMLFMQPFRLQSDDSEPLTKLFSGVCRYSSASTAAEIHVPCDRLALTGIPGGRVVITFMSPGGKGMVSFAGPADLDGDHPKFSVDSLQIRPGVRLPIIGGGCSMARSGVALVRATCVASTHKRLYVGDYHGT